MTCIVGIRTETGALLGGDARAATGATVLTRTEPKVYAVSDHVAVGFTGTYRLGQVLRYHVELPPVQGDEHEWLIQEVVPVMRQRFKDMGALRYEDGREIGAAFLFAVGARLFRVQADFQVGESAWPFDACGSGEPFALGALHSSRAAAMPPVERAGLALAAAAEFTADCGPPFSFVETTS